MFNCSHDDVEDYDHGDNNHYDDGSDDDDDIEGDGNDDDDGKTKRARWARQCPHTPLLPNSYMLRRLFSGTIWQ